jgi:hypothetical protein
MRLHLKIFILIFFSSLSFFSQNQSTETDEPKVIKRGCGTVMPPPEWDKWFNTKVDEYKEAKTQGKTQSVSLTIPVVVHVIHGGQSVGTYPNISQSQIKSQIAVLNKDFAGTGVNSNKLATTGFSLVGAANCLITFCLAQSDPSGNPLTEPGIDRLNYNSKGWTNPASATSNAALQTLMNNTIKPASIWDPSQYFNIWVSDENNAVSILGYATFPNGAPLSGLSGNLGTAIDDGIWIWARCFGTTGTLFAPYNLGRTATHETGHWLGLRHIGGDAFNPAGDCNATDYCADTPPQKGGSSGGSNGQNFGNPFYPLLAGECGSTYGNMFMNFMDYTDDAAMYLFTPDQNFRIQTAMQNGYFRDQLSASSVSLCTGAPNADLLLDSILCVNSDINALNQSFGDSPLTYSWTATPSLGVTFSPNNTSANPTFNFPSIGMYTLTTIVSNSIGVSISALEVRVEDCTGLTEGSPVFAQVSVFPSPSNGKLTLSFSTLTDQELLIQVYNTLGQLVLNTPLNAFRGSHTIDLTDQIDGIYNLVISTKGEKVTKRFVLNK